MSTPQEDNTGGTDDDYTHLQKIRESEDLSKKRAAEVLGVGYSTYRGWEKGRNTPEAGMETVVESLRRGKKLASIERQSEALGDPFYDLSSFEKGAQILREEPSGYMPESQSLSRPNRDVFWVPVLGDAMEDQYPKGVIVPIAKLEKSAEDISADDVYLISLGGMAQIKRLQLLPEKRIRVISSNSAYPNQVVDLSKGISETDRSDDLGLQILGRVLA